MARKKLIGGLVIVALVIALWFLIAREKPAPSPPSSSTVPSAATIQEATPPQSTESSKNESAWGSPLPQVKERVTKKPFGIFITPKNSPVQPERFSGYHTGTDFETFPTEQVTSVAINAICEGELLVKRHASGYGGVLVEKCEFDGKPVTVVYGHIALGSVALNTGEHITAGEKLGFLGAAESVDTDGERKHLHLGIHRGSIVDIRGYVSARNMLLGWIDPCQLVCSD